MKIKLKTSDGFELEAIFQPVKGSTKGVILVHGISVSKESEATFLPAAKKLNRLGFSTLLFDLRCHGRSSGDSIKDFSISGGLKDIAAAVDFMKSKGVNWLGLAAASVGGGIGALYAQECQKQIKALLLLNPALDYDQCFLAPITRHSQTMFTDLWLRLKKDGFIEIGSRKFKAGTLFFKEMKHYRPQKALKKYVGPLRIIHGTKDKYVDYQAMVDYIKSLSNSEKEFISVLGAPHGFDQEPYKSQAVSLIAEFFAKIEP